MRKRRLVSVCLCTTTTRADFTASAVSVSNINTEPYTTQLITYCSDFHHHRRQRRLYLCARCCKHTHTLRRRNLRVTYGPFRRDLLPAVKRSLTVWMFLLISTVSSLLVCRLHRLRLFILSDTANAAAFRVPFRSSSSSPRLRLCYVTYLRQPLGTKRASCVVLGSDTQYQCGFSKLPYLQDRKDRICQVCTLHCSGVVKGGRGYWGLEPLSPLESLYNSYIRQ